MVIGFWETLILLAVVLIIFGAGRISTMMGDLGKGVRSFKDGLKADDPPPEPPASSETSHPRQEVLPPPAAPGDGAKEGAAASPKQGGGP